MRKKIQQLTEEDLKRYERALQLWEISLRKQEAELEEREQELLLPVANTVGYLEENKRDIIERITGHFANGVVLDYEASGSSDWLERLGLLVDPRE